MSKGNKKRWSKQPRFEIKAEDEILKQSEDNSSTDSEGDSLRIWGILFFLVVLVSGIVLLSLLGILLAEMALTTPQKM